MPDLNDGSRLPAMTIRSPVRRLRPCQAPRREGAGTRDGHVLPTFKGVPERMEFSIDRALRVRF